MATEPLAETDVPVWCSEHMEPYCPRHRFRSVFWDDYANDLRGLDKRQRRRILRKVGKAMRASTPPEGASRAAE